MAFRLWIESKRKADAEAEAEGLEAAATSQRWAARAAFNARALDKIIRSTPEMDIDRRAIFIDLAIKEQQTSAYLYAEARALMGVES